MRTRRLLELLSLLGGQLVADNRSDRLDSLAAHLRWLDSAALPSAYLVELFPELRGRRVSLTADVDHLFELPYGERMILAALAAYIEPQRIFEFGTFTGATTRLLAETCPDADIETIDLPNGTEWDPWIADVVGVAFRDSDYRITQHRADTQTFDFTSRRDTYGLVFIDASHEHDDVLVDSRNALDIVREDGLIVWDDYKVGTSGVVAALNDLSREGVQIVQIEESRLAVHSPRGFELPARDKPAGESSAGPAPAS